MGAGGKKTALYRLARELPGRIALTATVLTPPFTQQVDNLVLEEDPLSRVRALARADSSPRLLGVARPSPKRGRWAGLLPAEVDALAAAKLFDAILVKADGARFRWIKAPAADEPALPSSATLVLPIISAQALGRPLDEAVAHHPEDLARLTGAQIGEPIQPEHVAALLSHPEGALKGVGSANVVPILNMVDDAETRARAERAAQIALARTDRFDRVLLASLTEENPIVAVIERS